MTDIILDDNMDLLIENGDFVIADSEEQVQQLILIATQGSFRGSPVTGIGIINYIKSQFTVGQIDKLRQKIKLQLQYDGYTNVSTQINSFIDIDIEATR
jgi:hypothetical protein